MRRAFLFGVLTLTSAGGCGTVEHDTRVPTVTEFTVAPKEKRYDEPRELEYRAPAPKKEFKPGLGAPNAGGAPGMGSGMGQQ